MLHALFEIRSRDSRVSRSARERHLTDLGDSRDVILGLRNTAEIAEAKNFSGHAEIRLHPHGNAQKLLHEAAAVATIYRFELVEPSLEEIFIQTVGGKADA